MTKSATLASCRPEQLLLYHYDELDAAGRLQLEEHLRACAICRQELQNLQMDLQALPTIKLELSPAEVHRFSGRVMARVRQRRRFVSPALGWSMAGVVTLLIALNLQQPMFLKQQSFPAPRSPGMSSELEVLPDLNLLQDLELLENLELVQQLAGKG